MEAYHSETTVELPFEIGHPSLPRDGRRVARFGATESDGLEDLAKGLRSHLAIGVAQARRAPVRDTRAKAESRVTVDSLNWYDTAPTLGTTNGAIGANRADSDVPATRSEYHGLERHLMPPARGAGRPRVRASAPPPVPVELLEGAPNIEEEIQELLAQRQALREKASTIDTLPFQADEVDAPDVTPEDMQQEAAADNDQEVVDADADVTTERSEYAHGALAILQAQASRILRAPRTLITAGTVAVVSLLTVVVIGGYHSTLGKLLTADHTETAAFHGVRTDKTKVRDATPSEPMSRDQASRPTAEALQATTATHAILPHRQKTLPAMKPTRSTSLSRGADASGKTRPAPTVHAGRLVRLPDVAGVEGILVSIDLNRTSGDGASSMEPGHQSQETANRGTRARAGASPRSSLEALLRQHAMTTKRRRGGQGKVPYASGLGRWQAAPLGQAERSTLNRRPRLREQVDRAREAEAAGSWAEAAGYYEQALETAQQLHHTRLGDWISGHLGLVQLAWGREVLVNVRSESDCRTALGLFLKALDRGFNGEYNQANIALARACLETDTTDSELASQDESEISLATVAAR